MTINELLKEGIAKLKSVNNEAPAFEAGVILCHVLGCDRTLLYVQGDMIPEAGKPELYRGLLERRLKGEPLQYITGHQEFMSLDFQVTKDVLIPRHDTETLVEAVIQFLKNTGEGHEAKTYMGSLNENKYRILDIGTGSGCIAVSLANYIKNSEVTAVDISEKALGVAKLNAVKNGVADRVSFVKSDLFSGIKEGTRFDAIVSNPPYIETEVIGTLSTEVRDYEPLSALDGGGDGLAFYRRIAEESLKYLKDGGLLAFEVGYNQACAVMEIMYKNFRNVRRYKDLASIDRVVAGEFYF